jgi:hypothetical protein
MFGDVHAVFRFGMVFVTFCRIIVQLVLLLGWTYNLETKLLIYLSRIAYRREDGCDSFE